jgi:hypothetical protein
VKTDLNLNSSYFMALHGDKAANSDIINIKSRKSRANLALDTQAPTQSIDNYFSERIA